MVDLFGGAIATSIPPSWRDVSQVRQVPDNQEVYQDCEEETGAVLVVELLEHRSDVPNDGACAFFLQDLAEANESAQHEEDIHAGKVVDLIHDAGERERTFPNFSLPERWKEGHGMHACLARGTQRVAQGKGHAHPRWIDVEVCVLRLENVGTDLLITLSVPRKEESDGRDGATGERSDVFKEVLSTFSIRDWGLFG